MASNDQDLTALAQAGTMDYARWPDLLERVIPHLEHIVYNDFPLPSMPLPRPLPQGVKKEESPAGKRESTERDEPPEKKVKRDDDSSSTLGESPKKDGSSPTKRDFFSSEKSTTFDAPKRNLPPLLLSLLQTIISTLRTSFPTSPPHTSQRLAELLLYPRNHYHTLPSYLRALDRIVSVASPASIFPLKNLSANNTGPNGGLLNGASSPSSPDPADDVDFIGGAELTEIPWAPKPLVGSAESEALHTAANGASTSASDLRTESTSLIDGPNGLGGVETVTVANGLSTVTTVSRDDISTSASTITSATATGTSTPQHGITQGELLRQEQEAGIVPVPSPTHSSQGGSSSRVTRSSAAASAAASRAVGIAGPESGGDVYAGDPSAQEEETVHARGPGVIGMEDMGPQAPGSGLEGGIDVEGALGRRGEIITPAENSETSSQGTGATQELDGMDLNEEDVLVEKLEKRDDSVLVERDEEKAKDKDAMVMDADGVPEREGGQLARKEESADAVDTTAL